MVRWRNVPVPEASLVGIAGGLVLERLRPRRMVRRPVAGWGLVVLGSFVVVRSVEAAGETELEWPEQLVTGGPYALSRNPMYVGWALVHLGVGLAAGSAWTVGTVPLAGALIHREILAEERRLDEKFGDAYRRYHATVRRYL